LAALTIPGAVVCAGRLFNGRQIKPITQILRAVLRGMAGISCRLLLQPDQRFLRQTLYNSIVKTATSPDSGRLSDQVAHYVVEHIRDSGLGPGEKVPSELRTAAHLQISRGIVREAYRSLRAAGILETANGAAPRVGQLSNKALVQILQHGLSTQQATVEDILDLRTSIEIRAAELAAMKRKPEHIAALREEMSVFGERMCNCDSWVETDLRFHSIVGEASSNPFFVILSSALRESLAVSIRTGFNRRTSAEEIEAMVDTHRRVARSIIAGDASGARKHMTTHFEEAREAILGTPQSTTVRPRARKR
jgi:GntR family transcriptional repressor for pyruvate dehydrogenase complex